MKVKVYPINYTEDLEKLCSNEQSAVGIEQMSITYIQPADTCSNPDELQHLTITTQVSDAVSEGEEGFYFDVTIPHGEHWSVESGEELSGLIEDFKRIIYNYGKRVTRNEKTGHQTAGEGREEV